MKPQYRVKRRLKGYEPQMLYCSAQGPEKVWFPLNENGYWLEPEAYNHGKITKHLLFDDQKEAERVLLRARSVNLDNLRDLTTPTNGE